MCKKQVFCHDCDRLVDNKYCALDADLYDQIRFRNEHNDCKDHVATQSSTGSGKRVTENRSLLQQYADRIKKMYLYNVLNKVVELFSVNRK